MNPLIDYHFVIVMGRVRGVLGSLQYGSGSVATTPRMVPCHNRVAVQATVGALVARGMPNK